MYHDYVSVQINAIMPLETPRTFVLKLETVCICGDRIDRLVNIPPVNDSEDLADALRATFAALVEEL